MPIAEFDILWPGNYELRAAFNGEGTKDFMISLGPTSMVAESLLLTIIIATATFFVLRARSNSSINKQAHG